MAREVEHSRQALVGDDARQVQGSPDVLLVDHAIDQSDHAPEPGCQPARTTAVANQSDEVLGWASSQLGCSDRIDPVDDEGAADESGGQIGGAQSVVADDVRDDIAHPPLVAQAELIPLLR